MSVAALVQLYTPLVGLIMMAFWVGGLSARVKQLEKTGLSHDDIIKSVARLEEKADALRNDMDSIKRTMEGVQRALANMMSGRGGTFQVIGGE